MGSPDPLVGSMRWPRWSGWLAELSAAVVVAAGVSVAAQIMVARLPIAQPSNAPRALLAVAAVVLLAGMLALVVCGRRGWNRAATLLSWVGLSALSTLALALLLAGTSHYLGGTSVDQGFRLQLLTRSANSPVLADMNYADLPGYYPAGWFWVGGRLADVLGIPAWQVYKPYSIATLAVVAVVVFTGWSALVSRPTALLVALVTSLVGLQGGAGEPYSWILTALMPPVAVLAWRALSRQERPRPAVLLGVGGFLGLSGAVYTLFAGLDGALIAVLAALSGATRRVRWPTLGVRVLIIAAAAAPLALTQWVPYLSVWLRSGMPGGAAARFLPVVSATLPLPMLEFSPMGVLSLIGLGWIVFAARRSEIAQGLGVLALVCYSWFGVSTLALATGQSLLPFRLVPLLQTVFAVAGVWGTLETVRGLRSLLPAHHARPVAALAVVVVLASGQSLVQALPTDAAAYDSYYPSGRSPLGAQDPARPGRWNAALTTTIEQMTGSAPADLVVLTGTREILAFWPFRSFQAETPHYANPLADYAGRRLLIQRWAAATSPQQLAAELDASPYRPPTAFVLKVAGATWQMPVSRDVFPRDPNVEFNQVSFEPGLFAGPLFDTRVVGPFVVAVRR